LIKIKQQTFKDMVENNLIRFKKHKRDYRNYAKSKRYKYVEDDIWYEYNNIKNT